MQQIYKVFLLHFYFIYKITFILINSIMICIFLSGCDVLFQNKNKNILLYDKKTNQNIEKREYSKRNNLKHLNIVKKYHCIVKKNETIISLLHKSGVNEKDILKLISIDKLILKNLKNSQSLSWKVSESGKLIELIWKISDFQRKIYKRDKNQLLSNISLNNFLIHKTILIKKNSTFINSALKSGLNQFDINNVIKAIEWQVDFRTLDINSIFNLIFLHNTNNKKNLLLGVKLNNSGQKYYSIRAFNGNFYDLNGYSKKTYFINFSFLKKYRISSNFNLHRINPVTHRVTPHLGVDFAMPQGTPVLATTNGKIIKACFNKIAGFYITLKDQDHYMTKYMHLKKILVKTGDIVKIGQRIGLSGNTGRTTGPHLHYEIWIDNHAVNPVKIMFKHSNTLNKKEKKTYLKELRKILKYLN